MTSSTTVRRREPPRVDRVHFLLLALLTVACGVDFGPNPAVRLEIFSVDGSFVGIGESVRYRASGYNAAGLAGEVGELRWRSADTSIARVSSRGLVTGRRIGTTTITAVSTRASVSAPIRVRSATCSAATTAGSLALGASLQAALTADDCFFREGSYFPFADGWRLTVAAPTTVLLSTRSSTFRTQTLVTDLQMRVVTGLDFPFDLPRDGTRVVRTLAAGTYIVWAAGIEFDQTGGYTVFARSATPCGLASTSGALVLEQVSSGELTSSDCVLPDGRTADGRVLTVAAPMVLGLGATSSDFAPMTLLTTPAMQEVLPSGFVLSDSTRSARMYSLAAGTYIAWTIPVVDENEGSYALVSTRMLPCGPGSIRGSIGIGETVADSLTLSDCLVPRSESTLGDPWQLTLAAPGRIAIDVTWSASSAQLLVEVATQAGVAIQGSASYPNANTSRHELSLPAGTYVLTVFPRYGAGAYSLAVTAVP